MSFLFGVKKKEAPAPSAKDSIRTLREACEALEKRQAHLEKEASACHAKAKERMAAKDKRGTMFQLQMQKMKLKEVESSQGKMLNLMTMINQIETAVMSSGIAQAMQVGAQALTQLAQEANVEKIEQIMDSVQEATDDLNEVQEAMARPIAHFDEVLVVFTVSHRKRAPLSQFAYLIMYRPMLFIPRPNPRSASSPSWTPSLPRSSKRSRPKNCNRFTRRSRCPSPRGRSKGKWASRQPWAAPM
jgi:hypothetical protein